MNLKTKICLAAVILIFLAALAGTVYVLRPIDSTYVEIVQDGTMLYTIDLADAENQSFTIESEDGGYNAVTIEDGQIYMSDADCPDGVCISSGVLRSGLSIVCLPHKLVIRFVEDTE